MNSNSTVCILSKSDLKISILFVHNSLIFHFFFPSKVTQNILTASFKISLHILGANLGKEKRKYMLCETYCVQIQQALFLFLVLQILYIFGYLHI